MLNFSKISLILLMLFFIKSPKIRTFENNNTYQYNKYSEILDIRLIVDKIFLDILIGDSTTLETGLEIHRISKDANKPLVIMGHSGIGSNALFNNLDLLKEKDEIVIKKGYRKSTYQINSIIEFTKGSLLSLPSDKDYLFLVTCDKYNMQKQMIISAKLVKNS